jgi:hypothetical protein
MANYVVHHKPGLIKDGKLDRTCGRIIIFGHDMVFSKDYMTDHNYLLRALAASFQVNKDKVISNAIRLYFCIVDSENLIVSGVRKIDDNDFESSIDTYIDMINHNIK